MANCDILEVKELTEKWIGTLPHGWKEHHPDFGAKKTSVPVGWFFEEYTPQKRAKAAELPPSTPEVPVSDRKRRLQEFRAMSDAAIAGGMPVLSLEQINEEVSELRGNGRGEL